MIHLHLWFLVSRSNFLEILAEQYGLSLTKAVRMYLMDRVGWLIPYHLQLLFGALREKNVESGVPPTIDLVKESFAEPPVCSAPGRRSLSSAAVQRSGEAPSEHSAPHSPHVTQLPR